MSSMELQQELISFSPICIYIFCPWFVMDMVGPDHGMGIGWLVLLASSNFRPLIQAWPYDIRLIATSRVYWLLAQLHRVMCFFFFSFFFGKEPPCRVIGIGKSHGSLAHLGYRYQCVHSSPTCDPVTYNVSTARSTSPSLRGRVLAFFGWWDIMSLAEKKQILSTESYARVSPELILSVKLKPIK